MTSEVHPTAQACLDAIDRIARTPDGAVFYVFLQRRLMLVPGDISDGALRLDQGERRFAAKLISVMAKGILESGRSSSSGGTSDTGSGEQPVVVPSPKPLRIAGRERNPGGRRIGPETRVPGYDPPDDAA